MQIKLAKIIIERESRQRKQLEGITSLAASIKRNGVIQPVVLDENFKLIAGERRCTAAKEAGLIEIPYVLFANLSAEQRERIELEENIKRVELSWRDECEAVSKYYTLRKADSPEITINDVAEELAMSSKTLRDRLQVQKEIDSGNEIVKSATVFSAAKNITERTNERREAALMEDIAEIFNAPSENVAQIIDYQVPLLNADFTEWTAAYTGFKFNFIHCDFPYGKNANKNAQGTINLDNGYADTPEVYANLLRTLAFAMDNVIAENAHLVFWFSIDTYEQTYEALTLMGWTVNRFPFIWGKSDNTGLLPDPTRGPRRIYETAFLASRGDRKIIKAVGNCVWEPATKNSGHMSEKPVPVLTHLFRMYVDKTTVMLDPTCGSGNAAWAASMLSAKSVLGLELDPEFYSRSVSNWKAKSDVDQIGLAF
jgi:ParB/RepB/Spo0J family partition protein